MQQKLKSNLALLVNAPWNLLLRTSDNAAGVLLAVIIGVLAGFGAWFFWWLIERFSWVFFNRGATWFDFMGDYYIIILPAVGGLIFGPIIYFIAREAKGEGPPEIMEALSTGGGRIRFRVGIMKVLASALCIGSGGAVGREGPIVQIGGSIGSAIGQVFRVPEDWLKTLVLCGVAGGVAATFNAPIAGAFFALEVIQRRIVARNVGFVILSSVMASIIARWLLFSEDTPTSFALPSEYGLEHNQEIPLYILMGIICAIAGLVFVKVFYRTEDLIERVNVPGYLRPAAGGLLVGIIGFLSIEFVSTSTFTADIFGVGYGSHYAPGGELLKAGPVDGILLGEVGLRAVLGLFAIKALATSITLGSGGSGGIFAPSLFLGAALGSACGSLFGDAFPGITAPVGAYALVGMAAFFAVVVRGPITAIIIVFELTGDYEIILPVMTSVVIAVIIARTFSPQSIYTIRLNRRGIQLQSMEEHDIMRDLRVSHAMTTNFPSVPPHMPVTELLRHMERVGELGFPVIDEMGQLMGIVTLTNVRDTTEKGDVDIANLTVQDIATTTKLIVAYPDQSLHDVLLQMGAKDFGYIPVVDKHDPKRLVGLLRQHDMVRAYINEISKRGGPRPPEGSIVF